MQVIIDNRGIPKNTKYVSDVEFVDAGKQRFSSARWSYEGRQKYWLLRVSYMANSQDTD